MSEEKAATCVAGGLKTTAWEPVLTMASNNGISATVQWTLPKGKRPERFELTWYNRDESITRPTLSNEYQISLKPGYTYTATVVGVNSSGISKQSKPITIQAKPLGPVNVTLASNQLSSTNSIIAKWTGTDARVTNYRVTAIELSTGTMKCKRSTICTCTLTDLKPGHFYRVYIEALLLEGPLLPEEVVLPEEAAVMLEEVVLPGEAVPPEVAVLPKKAEQMMLISERAFSQEDIQTYPAKVQNLKEEAVASGSYNFSWDTVIGATSYEFALKNSETNYVSHLSDHPEFVCSGLQLGMRYTAKVAAINGAGKGEYSKPVQFATSPEAPTAVRVNIDDHDSSLLHVDITEPAMKPDLYVFQLIENGKEHEPKTVQKPSHTFSGLKPAREYSVSVHSLSGGLGSRTRYSSAVQTCPEKVGGLELAGMTNSSLTVKWKNTPGAVSYRVRCTDEEQNQKVRVTELTKCVIDGLEPGKNYNISVTATNRIQSGKCSDELSVRMAPRVVTDIQVTNYAAMPHECLVVTFKDDNTKKNGYCVVAQPLSGGDDTVQETDKPSALIKGLTPGETYNIYVVVVDEEELESSREYYRDAVQTYPAAPKDVELVFTDSQLKFTWRHPNFKPDRYKVTWIANGDAFSAEVDETRFVLNNLSPSMTYRFSAAAINQAGMGEASDVQEYITAPAAPMNVHASVNPDSPETSFIVEYDDPDPPDPEKKYEVFACPISGEGPEVSQISDNRRVLLQDLVPGEAYHIYVVAIRGELRSEKAYRVS